MDVTELLEQDHREVELLFERFEQGDVQVLEQICTALEVHTMVEEEIVYPKLERIDRPLEQEAEQEHDEAKAIIQRIRAADRSNTKLLRQLGLQLKQSVQHHVDEEETKAFPEMRERMSDDLSRLGDEAEQRKQQLLLRKQGMV
jgi:hemerythrin superfamily protein